MRITDLGDKIPKNHVIVECYQTDNHQTIEQIYSNIDKELVITQILRERQKIELLKVPIFLELANDGLENNLSVAIFVNFHETLKILADKFNTTCVIHGKKTDKEREDNINSFQNNKSKLIICNIQSGGKSISLHDTKGGHQRLTIISPSYSSIDLIQTLSRCVRAEMKTPVIQKIIFCANTIEEKVCEKINGKIEFLRNLNGAETFY